MASEEPEQEEDTVDIGALELPCSLDGVKMADAPILFFVLSHNVFRKDLEELHTVVMEAAERGSLDREAVDDLGRRFEFLKIVYEYHSAAEDEILFPELDKTIKNVVSTYSLEHISINDDFNSLFHCLDLVGKEREDLTNLFRELLSSVGSIKSIICQHMLKEEQQVFPLVIKQIPSMEQAKIVWRFMCTIPIAVFEDFMAWMASFLPPNEQKDLLVCITTVVPKEEGLQEVVISWVDNKKPSSTGACNIYGNGARLYGGQASFRDLPKIFSDPSDFDEEEQSKKPCSIDTNSGENPIDGICIWNSAITRDFEKILIELSDTSSNLSSLLVQLQFFVDILIFHSKALDQILYPMLSELFKNGLPFSCKRLVDENQIERLQILLYCSLQCGAQQSNFLEFLRREGESLLGEISKVLIYIETEVFSFIRKNCSYKMQMWLLYAGLKSMPLGLLRCTVLWFSATLRADQFKTMLDGMNVKCPLASKSFSHLLNEWVRIGHLGKISMESIIKSLRENSFRGSYCTSKQIRKDIGFSDLKFETQVLNMFNIIELERNSAVNDNIRICNPSSSHPKMNEELESGRINLHKYFPQMMCNTLLMLKHAAEHGTTEDVFTLQSRPMDHFVCFHEALIRDLSHIVSLSADMSKSFQFFPDLQKRFKLLQCLYDIHSDSENEIVFPALESKGKLKNITHSYTIDHELEAEQLKKVSVIVDEMSTLLDNPITLGEGNLKYHQLCLKLQDACLSMQKVISKHIHLEDIELWPSFEKYFSIEEQEKIIGHILGRTRAETLTEMILWLMSLLKQDEWHGLISLWRKATKNTNFDEWLGEWCEGMKSYSVPKDEEGSCFPPCFSADPAEVLLMYLGEQSGKIEEKYNINGIELSEKDFADHHSEQSRSLILHLQDPKGGENGDEHRVLAKCSEEIDAEKSKDVACTDHADKIEQDIKVSSQEHTLTFDQINLETAIRRVSRDPALDSQKKSHIIQSLIMSRWVVTQKNAKMMSAANGKEEDLGQYPSYQDSLNLILGCKHYKRNCKLVAACCNKLFTCIRCHDDLTDHSVDRKTIMKMMCMKCLVIQPVGPRCSNLACNNFSMAKYYCKICKLFDDERQIYHCPYCNICRVGKGLGIDYFHCMKCNACMSKSLSLHVCREKCFEDNCPICHEYIFTSCSPVKALPCGHLMHSACFQEYTFSHYTCPICSKSLGDMQVYFGMLDALLAEEKVPEEYSTQTQVILCNDCERRGTASFHWLYHKCPNCGSYNTRLL